MPMRLRTFPESMDAERAPTTRLRYLMWLGRKQWTSIAAGTLYDTIWLSGLALVPFAIGRAIDEGVIGQDVGRMLLWTGVLLGLNLVHAAIQGIRNRGGVINWSRATYRSVQHVGRQVATAGHAMQTRLAAGDVTASVAGDAMGIAHLYYLVGALFSATVSYAIVAVLLLGASVPLGLLVLIGVPVFAMVFFFLVRPLRARQTVQREAMGRMTSLATDTVTGLRVLRGIGAERIFSARYRSLSATTRAAGMRVAMPVALVAGLQVFVGGALAIALTWLGALLVLDGQLRPGELVSFYGYAAFLVLPIQLVSGAISTYTRAQVGVERILGVLAVESRTGDGPDVVAEPPSELPVRDARSGLEVHPGRVIGLVSDNPLEATEIAERIARLDDTDSADVLLGSHAITDVPLDSVRRRITIADSEPFFFTGTLRDALDPRGVADDARIRTAVAVADAEEVLDALGDGLDTPLPSRARSLSGGQRQRMGLARAILAGPEILILLHPTNAVDAHTEGRIAKRLRGSGIRTIVIVTTSPILLAETDEVALIGDGVVATVAPHRELVAKDDQYATIIARNEGLA